MPRWATTAIVVSGALGLALVAAEGLVRLLHLGAPPVAVTVDERRFQELPGVFFPTRTKVDRGNPHLPYSLTVNSLGIRGDELHEKHGSRILFLGDSFTWGTFVDDSDALPEQVETLLACEAESLNFAVGGTSIDAAVAMFERALPLKPDIVVLVYHDNDLEDLRRPTYWERMASNRAAKSRWPQSWVYAAVRHTALWVVVRQGIAGLRARPAKAERQVDSSQEKAVYLTHLRALKARTDALGLPLIVTAHPGNVTFTGPETPAYAWFVETVGAEGLDYVDVLGALRASGITREAAYLLPFDGHASPAGYRVAAQVIADKLRPLACHS